MIARNIWCSGSRKVRLGEKKKKRFVIFDGRRWHLPDNADVRNDFVWCQTVCVYNSDDHNDLGKRFVIIGGIEIEDPRP